MTILRAMCFGTKNINTQIYANFYNLFKIFKFFVIVSALGVNEILLGFINKILLSF